MRLSLIYALICAGMVILFTARAQSPSPPPSIVGAEADSRCPADGSTLALNACAFAIQKHHDRLVATVTARYAATLKGQQAKVDFRKEATSWEKAREKSCREEVSDEVGDGGSMSPMVYSLCMAKEANLREQALRQKLTPRRKSRLEGTKIP